MEEEVLGKAYDSRLMRRLLSYMRPYRRVVFISLVFLFFNSLFQIAGPLLTKIAIDRYLVPSGKPMWTPLDPFLSRAPLTGLAQISVAYLITIVGALCRVPDYAACWRARRHSRVFERQKRGIDLAPAAPWESDKPTLHLFKYD